MSWFARLCRQSGLIVHHLLQPVQKPQDEVRRQETGRRVEERTVEPGVTLRRTTIEEIEFRPDARDRKE